MVTVQIDTCALEHATLVMVVLENDTPVDQRVRVANRLDGAVWPPRTHGVPCTGWDEGGWEGVVPRGSRVGVGFATPASPEPDPVELAWTERAATPVEDDSATAVVRSLADPRPPRDATEPTP